MAAQQRRAGSSTLQCDYVVCLVRGIGTANTEGTVRVTQWDCSHVLVVTECCSMHVATVRETKCRNRLQLKICMEGELLNIWPSV